GDSFAIAQTEHARETIVLVQGADFMRRVLFAVLLLSPLLLSPVACAKGFDGNWFIADCSKATAEGRSQLASLSPEDWDHLNFCQGFLTAIEASDAAICEPKGVTASQSMRVALKYMNDHPEWLHMPRWDRTSRTDRESASNRSRALAADTSTTLSNSKW